MTERAPVERRFLAGMSQRARALLFLGLVVAMLAVAFVLVSGGGGDIDDLGIPTGLPTVRSTTTRTPAPTASPTSTQVPETDDFFEAKDPFQPLVIANEGGGAPAPGGTASPAPTATSTTSTGGDGETVRVSLEDIFTENGTRFATVSVDGDQFTVQEGDTFADNFRVLDLASNCGTFVFGDERFTLCLGQEVRK